MKGNTGQGDVDDRAFRQAMRRLLVEEAEPLPPGLATRHQARIKLELQKRATALSTGEGVTVAVLLFLVLGMAGIVDLGSWHECLLGALAAAAYFVALPSMFAGVTDEPASQTLGGGGKRKEEEIRLT
jgi:hypothetical protein